MSELSNLSNMFINAFHSLVSVVSTIVIVALFLFYLKKCYKVLDKVIDELDLVKEQLNQFNTQNASDNYETIKEVFYKSIYLKNAWRGYQKTLYKVSDYNQKDILYATHDADEYFNLANISNGVNLQFWQNIGGIFTGLGILGTFLGLSIGLSGIDLQNISSKEIANLVSGMNTAFFTSLIGITLALIFSFLHKNIIDKLSKSIDDLNEKIETLFVPKNAEQLLADSYANSVEQSTQFKAFSTNLAISIGDALEQKLSTSSFADNIKNMDDTLGQVSNFMSQELPNVISNAIGEQIKENLVPIFVNLQNAIEVLSTSGQSAIADGIKGGASKELTAFADTLQQMNSNLQSAMRQMQETSGSVNNDLTAAITRVVDRLERQGDALQGVGNKVAQDLKESVEVLINEIGKQQSGMIDTSEKITDELKASIATMLESIQISVASMAEEAKKQQNSMQNSTDNITSNLSTKLNEMLSGFERQIAAIEQQTHNQNVALSETSNAVTSSFASSMNSVKMDIRDIMDQYTAKNKAENEETLKFIRQLKAGIAEQQAVLSKITTQVDALMARAANTADKFTQAAMPINDAGKQLSKQLDTVLIATNNYNQTVKQSVSELYATARNNVDGLRNINQEITRTKEMLLQAANQYSGVNSELEKILNTVNKNLGEYNEKIRQQYVNSLDAYSRKMSEAYNQLSTAIDELQDAIDDVKK